jgi:iron complex outermembrane receptor protein
MSRAVALIGTIAVAAGSAAFGEEPPSSSSPSSTSVEERIQVTATRLPEDVLDVPASITVVSGEELEARGVRDLAGALALAGGVSIAFGGDGGPASSVPELMGLREFDAFLLVVDGVPWGGAFNPALATLDLTNVDRIEVLRGAAPVLYGATSFVGVIHVIHRTPQGTPREVAAWGGNHDSFDGAVTLALPGGEKCSSSLSASYEDVGFKDPRTGFKRAHALWSAATKIGAGALRLWVDLTAVRQDPASAHPREGAILSPLVPLDTNHNPADARIDTDRYHVAVGYEHPAGMGAWSSTLALSHTTRDTVRGFLREEFDQPPGVSNADGYRQDYSGDDLYFDLHRSWRHGSALSLVAGIDVLSGKGEADSELFEYHVPPDGSGMTPSSPTLPIDEHPEFEDERTFGGAYAQALWTPAPRWSIEAGLRLNVTHEKQEGEAEEGGVDVRVTDSRSDTRPSGNVGASFRAWQGPGGALWIYGGYTNAFKPAAVDFGPEAEGEILKPETAEIFEAGLKGTHLDDRLFWQAWLYRMDFENLVISQTVNGLPALTNGGTQRFEGFELEGRWRVRRALTAFASFAAHTAKFRDYVAEFDGTPTQLAGNKLEMSPDQLASLGLTWYPERGFIAWGGIDHVGERYLNKRNTAIADPYTTAFAGVGYRFEAAEVRLDVENLTDERDPVSESELGDAQYYLLPARRYRATLRWRL